MLTNTQINTLPSDLLLVQERVYTPCNLTLHSYAIENESQEYHAASFKLNDYKIIFRIAKITPTKAGQFVTIWKRNGSGPIMPFDANDPIDFFMIGIRENDRVGQFIFPKQVLLEHDYICHNGTGGKRAIRVYPPWVTVDSPIAQKNQDWQTKYFFEIDKDYSQSRIKLSELMK